jgi:hypothetical protein
MMTGKVTAGREIELGLDVVAAGPSAHSLTAIIDTGFNGYLTLPGKVLAAVGAKSAGTARRSWPTATPSSSTLTWSRSAGTTRRAKFWRSKRRQIR